MDLTRETAYTAVRELKKRLREQFGDTTEVYLFGSVARGDFDSESDIDVLVLIEGEETKAANEIHERIRDLALPIELDYNVVFGFIVHSRNYWASSQSLVTPIHQAVEREGVLV